MVVRVLERSSGDGGRPSHRAAIAVCLSVAVAVAAVVAQVGVSSAQQQPTFRTGIQSVRVDLYATRDGQPVTDLRRDEINLLEDGVSQSIQTFERIAFAAPTNIRPADPKSLDESRRLAADPRSRLFVVFLPTADEGFALGPIAETRRLLLDPLNDLLGPDDLVAIMTPYTGVGGLTFYRRIPVNDTRLFSEADDADPKHLRWDACYPPRTAGSPNGEMKARHHERITFEALDALVERLGGLREERKHILLVTDGFRLYTENPALATKGGQALPGFPAGLGPDGLRRSPGDDATVVTSDSRRDCEADRNALAMLNHRNRLQELAAVAELNNVSFTPVSLARMRTQTSGTGAVAPRTFENTSPLAAESSLRGLAEDTGGFAIVNTNDVQGSLRRMMAATSAYYLLGYSPSNNALDGRFRKISVRISRPGTQVHARPGYTAADRAELSRLDAGDISKPPTALETAIASVSTSTAASQALHLRATAWIHGGATGAQTGALWIVGEIAPQQRSARSPSSARVAQMTIYRPNGGAAISKQVDVPSDGSSFEFVLDEPLGPGNYSIRVSVTAPGNEPLREYVSITLPEQPASLGEPIVLRRNPATAQRYIRSADPRFRRNERLRLELPTSSAGAASATLRDTKGATLPIPVTLAERPDESGAWRWITAEVQLAPLAPAVYALEVKQGTETRVVAFRVVP